MRPYEVSKYKLDLSGKFPRVTDPHTGIWTELVQMSRSAVTGRDIFTFRRHYPKFIHPEVLKHRMLPVSAESSRARTVMSVIKNIIKYPATFPFVGVNCKGMQSKERAGAFKQAVHTGMNYVRRHINLGFALFYDKVLNLHKQVVNRDIERDAMINDVTTGTDIDHFLRLRVEDGADPVIQVIAEQMHVLREQALKNCWYMVLQEGEWHVPFVTRRRNQDKNGLLDYFDGKGTQLFVHQAKELSAVSCAQTSYRRNGDVYDPTRRVWKLLIESKPVHATPVEHQATPMGTKEIAWRHKVFEEMLEALNCLPPEADIVKYSGCFRDWRQFRKEIEGEKYLGRFKTDREIIVDIAS